MSAHSAYRSSILVAFSTFVDRCGLNFTEKQLATEFAQAFVAWKTDLEKWSVAEVDQFAATQSTPAHIVQILKQFVHRFPPSQIGVFLHEYLLALKDDGCSNSTIRNYRSDINQFAIFAQKKTLDELIAKPVVAKFVRYEEEKGLQASSIRRKLASIAQFGLWAHRNGILGHDVSWLNNPRLLETIQQEGVKPAEPTPAPAIAQVSQAVEVAALAPLTAAVPVTPPPQPRVRAENKVAVAHRLQEQRARLQAQLDKVSQNIRRQSQAWLLPYLTLAVLVIAFLGLGVFGYQQFISNVPSPLAFPSAPTRPNRVLSFQGRLTDTAQNPITTATDMQFELFDAETNGNSLWDSGTCSVTPDQDGIFASGLGDDCGSEISSDVFTENANVWLEVTVEAETLTPRQPIRTVAYALNSETLQGYPISATGAATVNTVLFMNGAGDLVMGEDSPGIRGISGTFILEAPSIQIQTSNNGHIILDANGTGGTHIRDLLHAPGATFSANYAGGTALVLKGGPSGTANILSVQDSSSNVLSVFDEAGYLGILNSNPTAPLSVGSSSQFQVNSSGAIAAATGITSSGTITFSGFTNNGGVLYTNGSGVLAQTAVGSANECLLSAGGGSPTWGSCSGAVGDSIIWQQVSGTAQLKNSTLDLLVGGTSTASAKFAVLNVNTGTPVASISANSGNIATYLTGDGTLATTNRQSLTIGNSSTYNTTGNVLINPNGTGYLGIGTTNPTYPIHQVGGNGIPMYLNGKLRMNNSLQWSIGPNTSSGVFEIANESGGGTPLTILNNNNVGIGTTDPTAPLHVRGAYGSNDALTVNQLNSGNIFTASASGTTRMVLSNAGYLGIATTSPQSFLDININTGGYSANPILNVDTNARFTGTTTSMIDFAGYDNDAATNALRVIDENDNVDFLVSSNGDGGTTSTAYFRGNVGIGTTSPDFALQVNGVIAPETTDQDLGTTSLRWDLLANTINADSTITFSTFTNNGGLLYTNGSGVLAQTAVGSAGECLKSAGGGSPTWGSCSGTDSNYWRIANGAISPYNDTLDLLIGSNATASAKFAVLNVNSGTPTATIAGSTTGYGLSMTGDGTIATTLNRSLLLNPNGGNVGIGTTTPGSALNVGVNAGALTLGDGTNTSSYINIQSTRTQVGYDGSYAVLQGGVSKGIKFNVNNSSFGAGTAATIDTSGNMGIGTTTISARLHSLSTTEQLRLGYDASNYKSFTVGSDGALTVGGAGTNSFRTNFQTSTGDSTLFLFQDTDNGSEYASFKKTEFDFQFYSDDSIALIPGGGTGQTNDYFDFAQNDFELVNSDGGASITGPAGGDLTITTSSNNDLVLTTGSGDIVMSKFTTNGGLLYTNGSGVVGQTAAGNSGECLISAGGGTPTWGACDSGSGSGSNWRIASGAISPINDTLDLLVGSNATASAKFAVLNVNSGTPTATIAGSTTGYGLSMTGDGTIATTLNRSLLLNPNGGNVGIGTTSAPYKLTVAGDFAFDTSDRSIYRGTVKRQTFAATSTVFNDDAADLDFRIEGDTDANLFFTDASTDRVGIGTTTVSEKLHVSGNALATGNLYLGANSGATRLELLGAGGAAAISEYYQAESDPRWAIGRDLLGAGDAGIGFSDGVTSIAGGGGAIGTPDSRILAFYTSNGTSLTERARFDFDGDFNIGGDTDANALFTVGSTSQFQVNSSGAIAAATGITSSGTITFSGFTTNGGLLYTNGSGVLAQTGAGTAGQCLNGGTTPTWTNCSTLASNWRLSNGALSPINDTLDLLVGSNASSSAKFAVLNVNSGTPTATIAGSTTGYALSLTGDGTIATTLNRSLALNPNGGNVGIGTTSPTAKLHIADGSRASLKFTDTGDGITSEIYNDGNLHINGGGNNIWIDPETTANLYLLPASAGKIGVGTTDPLGKVDVQGATTGKALVTLNETGDQDIIAASASGTTRFRLGTDGYVHAQRFTDIANSTYYLDAAASTTSLIVAGSLNAGGASAQNFNFMAASTAGNSTADNSSDLYIQDELEVDGQTNFDNTVDIDVSSATAFVLGDGSQDYITVDTTTDAADTLFTLTGGSSSTISTGNIFNLTGDTITSGKVLNMSADALTTGYGLYLESTSTAFSTGSLGYMYWNPGSSTTATGDLLTLEIGANANIGKLFNIKDNGSSIFSVSESVITSALPHEFTAAGDLSVAYDLQFTNQTASFIKSYGPLTIESGESFENLNLTLKTYGTGDFVFDNDGSTIFTVGDDGDVTFNTADTITLTNDTNFVLSGGVDGVTFGTNSLTIDSTNDRVGIGTTAPARSLEVYSNASGYIARFFNDGGTTSDDGIQIQNGTDDNSGTNTHILFRDGDATNIGQITSTGGTVTYGAFTANHDASVPEKFNASGYPYGTVLCVDETIEKPGNRQPNYKVSACNGPYNPRIFGVYSSKYEEEPNLHGVYVLGDGQTLISDENGPVAVGDPLTSSSLPGYAMKATQSGPILGIATNTWDQSKATETKTLPDGRTVNVGRVALSYYPGLRHTLAPEATTLTWSQVLANFTSGTYDLVVNKLTAVSEIITNRLNANQVATDLLTPVSSDDLTVKLESSQVDGSAGKLKITNENNQEVASIDGNGNASFSGQTTLSSLLTQDATVSGEATINEADITSARIQTLESRLAEVEKIKAQTAEIVTATVSGTLYADDIYQFQDKVAAALQAPSLLSQLMGNVPQASSSASVASVYQIVVDQLPLQASGSGSLNKSLADLNLDESEVSLGASAVFINKYFELNGSGYISESLGIGNSLLIGNGTLIQDGVINYVDPINPGQTHLAIQPSGKGTLSLMAGLMTLSEDGNVTINGNVEVAGDLKVKSTLLTNLLKSDDMTKPLQVQVAGVATESGEVVQSRLEITNELNTPVATISAQGRATFEGGIAIASDDLTASGSAMVTTDKTSGKATVKALTNEVIIKSSQITQDSLIYVTPLGSTGNKVLYVKSQVADDPTTTTNEAQFVVGFDSMTINDVNFNWWIVN